MRITSKDDGSVKQAPIRKPVFEKYLPYLLFIFLGYCIADVVILNYRDRMLPTQPPPARPPHTDTDSTVSRGAYNTVISRNIFSSDGLIPDPLMAAGESKRKDNDSAPVPSSLPLALKGTIVHSIPAKSIANIELRSKSQVLAYSIGRDIDGLATLVSVERNKAIFRNTNNNRLEYIEMKAEGGKISFATAKPSGAIPDGKGDIAQVAPNKFEIKRTDLQKYLGNMSAILQQASMIPRRGANGEIECFKFVSIQPGSVYTSLGFQNGDCIKGVNGEKIDSPQKAMEAFNNLKDASRIKILSERDGRDQESDYTVK
jgi:general secretion pathway protein C